MRLIPPFLLLVAALAPARPAVAGGFDDDFLPKTMRVDLFHSGNASEERFAVDRVVSDGPWAGSRTQLADPLDLGKYRLTVSDVAGRRLLYSRGYASIFGEWQTTPEAKERWGTFHESLRFPWPKAPVVVSVGRRDADGPFREIWSTTVDPAARSVNPADLFPAGKVTALFENGPAETKVDLLILGDGYTASEMPKFRADAKRLAEALFRYEPFASRRRDFNVRLLELPSPVSGIHKPHHGASRRTPLSLAYGIFDSERYVLALDNRAIRDAAGAAPYDTFVILVNEKTYGGGGIYNCQATASVDGAFSEYIFVHEFGHAFGGLGDEYYTTAVAYETGAAAPPEPWEPNLSSRRDREKLKWADLVEPSTPVPTPWEKDAFEVHSRATQEKRKRLRAEGSPEWKIDELFREQRKFETPFLAGMAWSGKVGAFEGAGYEAKGLFRPESDCIMFTRSEAGFCRVCRRAISRVIDSLVR